MIDMEQTITNATLKDDRENLLELDKNELINLLFLHIRDIWSLDGLYYLGVENRHGTKEATLIDQEVWSVMGKIQARRLKEWLGITDTSLKGLFKALTCTDWWLDMEEKEYNISEESITLTNRKCRVHEARNKKGLNEFNCKQVRWGMLKNFAKEFDPNIEVSCHFCPTDHHPVDAWCKWEFSLKKD